MTDKEIKVNLESGDARPMGQPLPERVVVHDAPAAESAADVSRPVRSEIRHFEKFDAQVLCEEYANGTRVVSFWLTTVSQFSQRPIHVHVRYGVSTNGTGHAHIRLDGKFFACVESARPSESLSLALALVTRRFEQVLKHRRHNKVRRERNAAAETASAAAPAEPTAEELENA